MRLDMTIKEMEFEFLTENVRDAHIHEEDLVFDSIATNEQMSQLVRLEESLIYNL